MQVNIAENKSWIYWLPLVVLGVIYTLCFYYYPYLNDDLEFRAPMSEYIAHPSWATFIEGWTASVCDRFLHDNGRLPQIIGSVMVVIPKLFMSAIMALCLVAGIYMTAKAAGVWRRSYILTALAAVCWVLVFPWADYMFGIMFYMNYIPVSAILLVGYYCFINKKFIKWLPVFLLGLLLGCMHEIFAGTMFCGALCILVLFKRYRTRPNIAFCISIAIGILYLIFTPGTASRQHGAVLFGGFEHPFKSAVYAALLYAYILLVILSSTIKGWRANVDLPKVVLLTVMALTSWLIWRTFLTGLRVSWCLNVVSLTGMIYLLSAAPVKLSRIRGLVAALLWALAIGGIAICLPWCIRFDKDVDEVHRLQATSSSDVVFYDMTEPADVPLYTLAKPNFNAWKLWSADFERVLPVEARNFDIERSVSVGDGVEAYRYGRSIVLPFDEKYVGPEFNVTLTLGGKEVFTSAFFIPFENDRGERYLYAKFYFIPLRVCRNPIDRMEITGIICKD